QDLALKDAEGHKALLVVRESAIFEGGGVSSEEVFDADEINAVLPYILFSLRLVPFHPHKVSVATERSYVKNMVARPRELPDFWHGERVSAIASSRSQAGRLAQGQGPAIQ